FGGIRGYSEAQDAFTVGAATTAANKITGVTGSLGTKFSIDTHIGSAKVTPFVSLAAELNRFDDGLGAISTYAAPRIAIGMTSIGRAGDLSMILDGGNVEAGTKDISLSISYALRF
ncbi:MAG: hypothetical protein WBC85_07545, partial [Planktotalea sp.]|uniref:hypothetical protein n=1 Tax=Planktotalea sp. TaxID=2029877 RepID=UPI003C72ADB7